MGDVHPLDVPPFCGTCERCDRRPALFARARRPPLFPPWRRPPLFTATQRIRATCPPFGPTGATCPPFVRHPQTQLPLRSLAGRSARSDLSSASPITLEFVACDNFCYSATTPGALASPAARPPAPAGRTPAQLCHRTANFRRAPGSSPTLCFDVMGACGSNNFATARPTSGACQGLHNARRVDVTGHTWPGTSLPRSQFCAR